VNLNDFKFLLDDMLFSNDEASRRSLLEYMTYERWRSLFTSILFDEKAVEEISKRSYVHANGFLKILLVDKRPMYSIRLHIWPSLVIKETDIHDHPWDFDGFVLNGEYDWYSINEFFPSSIESKFKHYTCKYAMDYTSSCFKLVGGCTLGKENRLKYSKGDYFSFRKEGFHYIEKTNNFKLDSILVTGPASGYTANVITKRYLQNNVDVRYEPLSNDDVRSSLNKLLCRI